MGQEYRKKLNVDFSTYILQKWASVANTYAGGAGNRRE